MSQVAITGNASGTGTFTIVAPNSNTDRTINLPDQTGTLLMTDASGNLGLGVTPSAWASYFSAVQAGNASKGAAFVSSGGFSVYGHNFYEDSSGTSRYVQNTFAAKYATLGNGFHAWFTAPAGTAGNPISFTQAMTLTAAGDLLLNTTSSGGRLVVAQSNASQPAIYLPVDESTIQGPTTNTQIRMGNNLVLSSNGVTTFGVGGSERARIDSSGNLLVGTTSLPQFGGVGFGVGRSVQGTYVENRVSTANFFGQFAFYNTNGRVGEIATSGSSTTYSTSSDYRLKEDIAPMTGALAKVQALKPCTYKWKADGSDGEGFIAHELQAVCPDAVTGEKDAVDAEGKPVYQGIDTSFLVATLTAAIQELHAKVQALESRLALEGASDGGQDK